MRNSLRSGLLAAICAGSMLAGGCGGTKEHVTYLTKNEFEWDVGERSVYVHTFIHGNSISDDLEINSGLSCFQMFDDLAKMQTESGNAFYLVSDVPIKNFRNTMHGDLYGAINGSESKKILEVVKNDPNKDGFRPRFVYKISKKDGSLFPTQSNDMKKFGVYEIIEGNIAEKDVNVMPVLCVSYAKRENGNSGFKKRKEIFCGPKKRLWN